MKLLAKLSFLLFLPVFIQAENLIVGYYPDWGKWNTPTYTWKEVPYEKMTHVLWSFISPDSLGNLRGNAIDDPADLDSMVASAHKVNTKVIISLGGDHLPGCAFQIGIIGGFDALRAGIGGVGKANHLGSQRPVRIIPLGAWFKMDAGNIIAVNK